MGQTSELFMLQTVRANIGASLDCHQSTILIVIIIYNHVYNIPTYIV